MLTAVASILLVPTLIAGIYGMNLRELPGSSIRFGFWAMLVMMIALGGLVWFTIMRTLRRRTERERGYPRDDR